MTPISTKEVKSVPKSTTDVWVTGLHPKLTDNEMAEFFGEVAPVLSLFIFRTHNTKDCLGFGYATFSTKEDAINARDSLHSKSLKGQTVSIMLSMPVSIPTNGCGNMFVGNLEATIDSEYLREVFSEYGTILSCRVVTDRRGRSKGYGFVHYENEMDAESAKEMRWCELRGKEIEVCPFMSKKARNEKKEDKLRTTVYIKNMSEDVDYEFFTSVFSRCGRIRYADTTGGLYGHSRGTGFVTFEIEEEAARAVEELNGHIHDGKTWQVERGWTEKMERKAASTSKFKPLLVTQSLEKGTTTNR